MKTPFFRRNAAWLAGLFLLFAGCVVEVSYINWPEDGKTAVIGAILPLTGKNAEHGEAFRRGIETASFYLNNRYGVNGKKFKVVYYDTQSTPTGAVKGVRAMAAQKAAGILFGYDSAEANAAKPEIVYYELPAVALTASSDKLYEKAPTICMSSFTDSQQGEALAAYCWFYRRVTRLALLVDAEDPNSYHHSIARMTSQAFIDLGGEIRELREFHPSGGDADSAILKTLETAPQAIMVVADAVPAGKMIRQLRAKGFSGLLIGADSWDRPALLRYCGAVPGDCTFVSFSDAGADLPETRNFARMFQKIYQSSPNGTETQGYDALMLLCAGLDKAVTARDFAKNFRKLERFPGAAGYYSYQKSGKPDRTIHLKVLRPAPLGISQPGVRLYKSLTPSRLRSLQEK